MEFDSSIAGGTFASGAGAGQHRSSDLADAADVAADTDAILVLNAVAIVVAVVAESGDGCGGSVAEAVHIHFGIADRPTQWRRYWAWVHNGRSWYWPSHTDGCRRPGRVLMLRWSTWPHSCSVLTSTAVGRVDLQSYR